MEESIYNIIPHNPQLSPKRPIYRSKYPYNILPTGSTFLNHTTSKPLVGNLSGDFEAGLESHKFRAGSQTFGHLKGDRKNSPTQFQKKGSGTMGSSQLPPVRSFSYDCSHKKQRVPRASERPSHGLRSNKDFIVSNAIEAILSTPKQTKQQKNWLVKKDYGKTPEYLNTIKQTLDSQYKLLQTLHQQRQQKKKVLSPQQIQEIREGLKQKWNQTNRQYQKMTHVRLVDTTGAKRRKQNYQSQLQQVQEDIKKLNKQYIFVE